MFKYFFFISFALLLGTPNVMAQQPTMPKLAYPRTVGYLSFSHTVVVFNKDGTTFNFAKGNYSIAFPCGINVLKSDRIGFSFELTPTINFSDSISKVSNVLFHPGIMFRYPHGFTFISRLAFETAGRYGFTAVFNKVVVRTKANNYFIAIPVPFRFGNGRPASVGAGLQIGITF